MNISLKSPAASALLPFSSRIVPVVELPSPELAVPLANTLLEAGIDVIEITLRTSAALESIRLIQQEQPRMRVAAGTVINPAQMDAALKAGAKMVFSPGTSQALLDHARACRVQFFPGVATASEVMQCINEGFEVMKLFPADALQALKLLKTLAGPFADARFIPTGGISESNIHDYVMQRNVLAVGASAVAPKELISKQDWAGITQRAKLLLGLTQLS
jgi:2-dehydro-3-deoxyphosphogluconate aldolase / (4S)-4-hydroxy-2-oxoglutarate aldolase